MRNTGHCSKLNGHNLSDNYNNNNNNNKILIFAVKCHPIIKVINSLDVMKEKFNRLHFHFGPSPNRHLKTKQMIYKFNMRLSK